MIIHVNLVVNHFLEEGNKDYKSEYSVVSIPVVWSEEMHTNEVRNKSPL